MRSLQAQSPKVFRHARVTRVGIWDAIEVVCRPLTKVQLSLDASRKRIVSSGNRDRQPTSTSLLHLDNDLPLGSTLLEIRKSLLRLLERKHLVYHWPNAPCPEQLTDLCELTTVRVHEQERIRDAALFGAANDLAAQ